MLQSIWICWSRCGPPIPDPSPNVFRETLTFLSKEHSQGVPDRAVCSGSCRLWEAVTTNSSWLQGSVIYSELHLRKGKGKCRAINSLMGRALPPDHPAALVLPAAFLAFNTGL